MSVAVSSIEVECFRFAMIGVFLVSDFSDCGCNNSKSPINSPFRPWQPVGWNERIVDSHVIRP